MNLTDLELESKYVVPTLISTIRFADDILLNVLLLTKIVLLGICNRNS